MPTLFRAFGDGWNLEIVGAIPSRPPFVTTRNNSTIIATGLDRMEVHDSFAGVSRQLLSGESVEPLFFETVGYDIHFERTNSGASIALPGGAEARRIRGDSEHYHLNFGNNVGYTDIHISCGKSVASIRIEVFSRKIDYRDDYFAMRSEISQSLRNLAIGVSTKTYSLASPAGASGATLLEWFALVRSHFSEIKRLAQSIASSPHLTLERRSHLASVQRAKKVSRQTLARATRKQNVGPIHQRLGASLPPRIAESVSQSTFNTPENRYLKGLVVDIQKRINTLIRTAHSGDEDSGRDADRRYFSSIRPDLFEMNRQISAVLRQPFFRGITYVSREKPDSMVFHTHPQYARFDKICRLLLGGLSLTGDVVQVSIKDTAQIYEYWCFLKIVTLLCARFDLQEQSIVKFRRTKVVVALEKGRPSMIRFLHKESGKHLHVIYNRMFNRLPTLAQKPDNVIQLASETRLYILDAKYRIQFDDDYLGRYGSPGPTEEDINTMHRYRDAIAIPHPVTQELQRGVVLGAAVLFPHPREDDYEGHRFLKSIDLVEIGGIPFLPNSTRLLQRKLDKLIEVEFGVSTEADIS